ncbi:dihydrofolate reductase [Paraliobacillus quinghaiensis]|uniref:Dihydrofolate reductase n=1 Tax=Paraliobacillus quinghaiensis TaxID=470815 RepID=A0A917WRG6_9BACI|nr:dihydrofolate reductase [Paraliobacillus quinghaiensis]GGM23257.1 dihydrofolate reductase [Paraliobacillus quinghaiensis]
MISFVFAMDKNQVIGHEQWMPWDLPRDLQFFKEKTLHHTIIMGRKTFESFNKPLPKRHNVVLTRDHSYKPDGCEVIHSIDPLLEWNKENPEKEYFVIGGGTIFKQTLPYADRMYMTYIDDTFPGDTYFPDFDLDDWNLTSKTKGIKDEKNQQDYYFLQYDRKNKK